MDIDQILSDTVVRQLNKIPQTKFNPAPIGTRSRGHGRLQNSYYFFYFLLLIYLLKLIIKTINAFLLIYNINKIELIQLGTYLTPKYFLLLGTLFC